MFQAFLLVDSAGSATVEQGRDHMVSGDILDVNTLAFDRVGTSGQAEVSYALVECFNNELNVQSGEILLASGTASTTGTIAAVDPTRSIVIVNSRTDIAATEQYQAHATGELINGTTVQVTRAATATSANTTVRYQVVEFSAASGASVQTGQVAFNGGQSTTATLGTAVDMSSSWLYFSYDATSDGPQQTAIKGQLTSMNQVTFARHAANTYNNRIRYYVVTFPTGEVLVKRGASAYTGGTATATHNIGFAGVSALNKAFTFVSNTTADTGGTGGSGTVTVLNAFPATPQLTGTTGNLSGTYTISAGSDRLLVVAVDSYSSGGQSGLTYSATYGGRALTQAVIENSNRRHTWIGYLREADIAARSGNTISVTITGTHSNVLAYIASYSGVDQTTPIAGSSSIYGNNSSASYQFPAAITVSAGGYGIYTWTANQTRSSDTETYTEHAEYQNNQRMGVASKAITSAGTTRPSVTYASTARVSQSIIALNPAAGTANAYPRNRWTEMLSSATNILMSNWRGDTTGANANFEYQVVEFAGGPVYGDGSDLKVDRHFSTIYNDPTTGMPVNLNCVECHNPMSAQSNLKAIRSTIRGNSVVFTAYAGAGSFADGGAVRDGICEVCHTQTNHHQADGVAPGGQSHNDGTDCRTCHAHINGYQPVINVPAPHNTQACITCHTAEPNYTAPIANTACLSCHDGTGSTLTVDTHFSTTYIDPSTGALMDLECVECHNPMFVQTNFRGNSNLAFIRGTIRGNQVAFEAYTGQYSFASDNNKPVDMLTQNYVCNTCHTQTVYHQADGVAPGGQSHNDGVDCSQCHMHSKGFQPGGCTSCHAIEQNGRAASAAQFSANSHHVQGVAIDETHCYQCHWEANSDGSINSTYHGGPAAPGSAVNLVIYGSTARPTTYTVGSTAVEYTTTVQTRTELTKINQVCLGCHDADSGTAQPFADGKTPKQYAWDGLSIAERYSQAGSTTWGKYPATTNAAQKNIVKAYSAHGNASVNAQGWSTTTGVDSTIPNRTGGINVLCIDCHNSHGSNASGTTTYYLSATTNGGLMKDVTAGLGGSAATYTPADFAGSTTMTAHSAGSALCFNCHMTPAANATRPWGYQTFGATDMIISYFEKVGWEGGVGVNAAGAQIRYPYKNNLDAIGSHFGASAPLTTTPADTVDGLCSACHDPHGVSPSLGVNQQYSVPLLKGTWMTSPYKEDAAPSATNESRGGSASGPAAYALSSTPGYKIDQNTFENITTSTATTGDWQWPGTNKLSQTSDQFGGLCLSCHAQSSINPTTSGGTWSSMDRIHNTVKGWGGTGANAGNAIHAFSCSKCHTPHSSCLPRLMISNCLDYSHRGRVASGGTPGQYTGSGSRGQGRGRFPGGGGGNVASNAVDRYTVPNGGIGQWFAGNGGLTSGRSNPALNECHNVAGAGGTTWPGSQRWNTVTPW
jgi:hypothetical protein